MDLFAFRQTEEPLSIRAYLGIMNPLGSIVAIAPTKSAEGGRQFKAAVGYVPVAAKTIHHIH